MGSTRKKGLSEPLDVPETINVSTSNQKLHGLAIAISGLVACAQTPLPRHESQNSSVGQQVPVVYAPECPQAENLAGVLTSFTGLPLDMAIVPPTRKGVMQALASASGPWLLLLFSGHGHEHSGESSICLSDGLLSVNELVHALAQTRPDAIKGAVFVLNACESAAVDPSRSTVPLSIISASPEIVRTDSLFGESLRSSLLLAAEDFNCDGLVTDQELFAALLANLDRSAPGSTRPALPKLRRQATSEIPLPMPARRTAQCDAERAFIGDLVRNNLSEWAELGAALQIQLDLASSVTPQLKLPRSPWDYYTITPGNADSDTCATIEREAEAAGLKRLPKTAEPYAERLARFSIFAQFYELNVHCGSLRIQNLENRILVATAPLTELSDVLPRRNSISLPKHLFPGARGYRRALGMAEPGGLAIPCDEQTGQCFALEEARVPATDGK
jgi:hypothetical protein